LFSATELRPFLGFDQAFRSVPLRPNTISLTAPQAGDSSSPDPNAFSLVGVSAGFLLEFIDERGGRAAFEGKTTTQVNELVVQPETSIVQASYCELLRRSGKADRTGTATWFVSHAWKYEFLHVVDAILAFVAREGLDVNATVVWFDLFSNSQHNTAAKPFAWWTGTFTHAIETMGNVLMVMSPWDDPVTLTRAWCVFEVYACVKTSSRFEVAMTREENERFLDQISRDPGRYYAMLAKINSANATAFKPEDRDAIFAAIRSEVGFAGMDSMVFRALEGWMERELQRQIAAKEAAGDERGKGFWMHVLGRVYKDGGKLDKAEPMYEQSLEINRRLRGEDHPDTLASMNNLASLYEDQGRLDQAEPLYVACLDKKRAKLGEDHPSTLTSMNNLAVLYEAQGRLDQAEPLYVACLDKTRAKLGEDHPDTLASRKALAQLRAARK
jgi:hypothetical protein